MHSPWAPAVEAVEHTALDPLLAVLRGRRVVALTGAGISTESGIPDYRGPVTGQKPRQPITLSRFLEAPAWRERYWARSATGWPAIAGARPNAAHHALAQLEARGALRGIITQNVDGLHQAAGSVRVVELHGALHRVRCLQCGALESRERLQARLLAANPALLPRDQPLAPDGDAEVTLPDGGIAIPGCTQCAGLLKPDVVFFGENVPLPVVQDAWTLLGEAEVLLVAGSSLTVFSGFRFVKRAHEDGIPVIIVNVGPTRADALASHRLEGRLGDVLPALADRLVARSAAHT